MNRYQTKVEKSQSSYTLDDHPQLLRGENEQLFSEFRKAMLALDPCVTEVFLKLYVAYKAETNFVDVIPKAKGMRLTLNLSPHELDDPKEISKDISDKGKWGNGDVSVDFNNLSELPYIIGLIRQSFDKQMGAGASNV
jgi:predicted transport protein